MEIKEVMELLRSVEKTGWKVFEVKEKDFCFRLERDIEAVSVVMEPAVQQGAGQPAAQQEPPIATGKSGAETREIKSPLVGVFHELEGNKKVDNGMFVQKGQPICIIEAMKLMNEIVMPEDGTILWHVSKEGDAVEFGQLLFQYTPEQS